ncbi:hypothetical protein [Tenacibaculum maritimum]|uniref:hypothetical protein n=1 Tax=Tenacibaculum maritimum TaxID=107401 RepID=UPI0012E52D33|nr:hypothetical protein [Tenacibaculum maritimum]CAA0241868.1 conserved hypothetical protein [Tenacibaculum maritimum]
MFKNFNWNILLAFSGGLIFLISIVGLWTTYNKKVINENGIKVIANIIESPINCLNIKSRKDGYCKLEWKGKVYVKRAGKKFCHLVSGKKKIEMLTDAENEKLIFVDEYDSSQFGYSFMLMLISFIVIYKGIKQANND